MFQEDFPQFCQLYTQSGSDEEPVKLLLPETMLQTFIDRQTTACFPPGGEALALCSRTLCGSFFCAVSENLRPGSRNAARRLEGVPGGNGQRSCNGGYYAQLRQQRRDSRNREMGNLECNPVWPAAGDNGEAGRNGRDAGVIFDNPIFQIGTRIQWMCTGW